MDHMTAKLSCFARAFHFQNNQERVFRDDMAGTILGENEYWEIAKNLQQGIHFFAPGFTGSDEEALRFIVDCQLSPAVLGRSAFCEYHLKNERRIGCTQYVIFASGYDTYALRSKSQGLKVFELDLPEMIADKERRISENKMKIYADREAVACDLARPDWKKALVSHGFQQNTKSYGSLLGISYYLTKAEFLNLLQNISDLWAPGSALCFDYPLMESGEECRRNRELAAAAKEQMKASYSYSEIEEMLSSCGFLVYEHLNDLEMTKDYFQKYSKVAPEHVLTAPKGVCYVLAVRN